jgi:hypothetical protein
MKNQERYNEILRFLLKKDNGTEEERIKLYNEGLILLGEK